MIQILALTAAALFQFLMVQLKVYHPNLGQSRRIFQFLMVQLKVSSVKRHKHFSVISIPYGSIKSIFC